MQDSSVKLIWKKNFLSGTYNIYENNQPVGELNDNFFSNSSEGIFKQKRYKFKSKGFFNQRTEIIDLSDGNTIGDITYNSWFNEAKIKLHD